MKPGPAGSRLSTVRQSQIRAALKMGFTLSEAARKMGVTRDEARTVAEHAGLAPRPPSRGGPGAPRGVCADCGQWVGAFAHRCPPPPSRCDACGQLAPRG